MIAGAVDGGAGGPQPDRPVGVPPGRPDQGVLVEQPTRDGDLVDDPAEPRVDGQEHGAQPLVRQPAQGGVDAVGQPAAVPARLDRERGSGQCRQGPVVGPVQHGPGEVPRGLPHRLGRVGAAQRQRGGGRRPVHRAAQPHRPRPDPPVGMAGPQQHVEFVLRLGQLRGCVRPAPAQRLVDRHPPARPGPVEHVQRDRPLGRAPGGGHPQQLGRRRSRRLRPDSPHG
ncbi:hypothetical protein [Asanoa siamensis]|uniref:hypothetical protein n=1 Tax=Asanoa siamensis TaxID=926357 RepID=UPI0019409DEC|nr:hypothetical protein [Asanoa siamensis]